MRRYDLWTFRDELRAELGRRRALTEGLSPML
jgi:hypothetical protein